MADMALKARKRKKIFCIHINLFSCWSLPTRRARACCSLWRAPWLIWRAMETTRRLRCARAGNTTVVWFALLFFFLISHQKDAFDTVRSRVGLKGCVISLADHATGGLVLGRNYPGPSYPDPYAFFVRRLVRAKASIEAVAKTIISNQVFPFIELVNRSLSSKLCLESCVCDVFDVLFAVELSDAEQASLQEWSSQKNTDRFVTQLGELVSAKDFISWSTWGHDGKELFNQSCRYSHFFSWAVDVGLYCAGACPPLLKGSLRNDEVGRILSDFLGVAESQAAVTARLASFNTSGHDDGWRGEWNCKFLFCEEGSLFVCGLGNGTALAER